MAILTIGVGLFLFFFIFSFESLLKGGFVSRLIAGGVVATCLAVVVFFMGVAISSTAHLLVIFIKRGKFPSKAKTKFS